MHITIRAKDVPLTPELKEYIEKEIGSLAKFDEKIMDAKVELERSKHHKSGNVFWAACDLRLAYNKTLRSENTDEDIKVAVNRVREELQRNIKTHKESAAAKEKRGARAAKKLSVITPEARLASEEGGGGRTLEEGL